MKKTLKVLFLLVSLSGPLLAETDRISESSKRIISMSPAITESLYYFNMDKNLVGVSEYCKTPAGKVAKQKVGSPFTPMLEKIISLKPTVVLTQDIKDTKLVGALNSLKIPYRSYNFNNLEEIQKSLNLLAKDFGGIGIEDYNTKFLSAQYSLRKKQLAGNYLAVIGIKGELDKMKGFVVAGDDTYIGQIITSVGLTNLSPQEKGYGEVGLETFLKKKLHYLFFFTRDTSLKEDELKRQLTRQFKAVEVGKVILFNNEYALVPGPRVLDLMKDVANVL